MAYMKPRQLTAEELAESNRQIVEIIKEKMDKEPAVEAQGAQELTAAMQPAAPEADYRGNMIARRDQLQAALQENASTIFQIERELENRRATQHQIFGSIRTLNDLLGEQQGSPA